MRTGIPTVLIIDDDPGVRELISAFGDIEGFDVIEAEDGSAGVELAARHSPTLILCDQRMPRLPGRETLLALKKNPATARIPVTMIAGFSEENDSDWIQRGAIGVLNKPFTFDELIDLVRNQAGLS